MHKWLTVPSRLLIMTALCSWLALGQGTGVWEKQCVDSSGNDTGEYNSLAYDSQNNPHISYFAQDFDDLRYAVLRNGIWEIVTVDSAEYRGEYCSIAIDQQDRPHIAYKAEYTWGIDSLIGWHYQTDLVMHAVKSSAGWATEIVDSMMRPFMWERMAYTSISIDATGNPAVSYESLLDSARLEYAHFDGAQWQVQHIRTLNMGTVFTKLLFKNGTEPIIAYHEYGSLGANYLRFAYLDGSSHQWKVVTTPLPVEEINVLGCDIDGSGTLYFVALGPDDSLRVATYDWQHWVTEAVYYKHDNGGIINRASLKVDRTGQPALIVLDSRQIHYLRKVSGQWQRTFIEEWPVNWWTTDISLAFDADNNPGFSLRVGIPRPGKTGSGVFFYRHWPGSPQIQLANNTHDYDTVWTQSFSNWNCIIRNLGAAPLIVSALQFQGGGSVFQHTTPPLPKTIAPHDSGFVTIRFTPPAAISYSDSLTISSNDPVHPTVKAYLLGSGGTSGTTADVACEVQSAYIDHGAGRIKTDRYVVNASVSLLQNSQLKYGPAPTDMAGTATITGVPVGTYSLRISKIVSIPGDVEGTFALDTLGFTLPITLGPGVNSKSVAFPDSIIKEAYAAAYELGHIATSKWDTIATYGYPSASEVRGLMRTWSAELPPDATESAARLIVADRMVARMFFSGFLIGTEAINDIGELINFLLYTNCWSDSFLSLLKSLSSGFQGVMLWLFKELLISFLKDFVLDLVGEGIKAAVAQLPIVDMGAGGKLNCPKLVMDLWDGIRDRYIGGTDPVVRALPFVSCIINDGAWSALKGDIYGYVKHTFFQLVYVNALTNPAAERACDYSRTFTYDGDFHHAYEKTEHFIADKTQDVGVAKDISEYSVLTAKLLQATSEMLGTMGTFIPGAGPMLDLLATISNYASYAMVGTAVGVSTGTFFALPSSIEDAVGGVYSPGSMARAHPALLASGMPRAVMPAETRLMLKQQLTAATSQYDSVVHQIESQIRTGYVLDAVQGLEGLTVAERTLRNGLKMSAAPLYAVASYARDSVMGFQSMYDSIGASHARAGLERFENCLYIATLLADSSGAIKDSVVAQLDRSLVQNGVLASRMSVALDSIASLPVPPVIAFSLAVQDVYTLNPGSVGTVTLKLKNLGGTRADSVRLLFRTDGGIRAIEAESVFVGALLPGQESQTFTWHVGTYGSDLTRGLWTATLYSSNATAYPYSGLFSTPSTTGIGGLEALIPDSYRLEQNYPNPFNPSTTIRYGLPQKSEVQLTVFNTLGQKVATLVQGKEDAGYHEVKLRGSGLSSGVYFYRLEAVNPSMRSGQSFVQTKKLLILR
jgi:hypothetical protein